MKGLQNSAIGDFTRGGQTVLMFVRMIGEVLQQFTRYILFVYFLTTFLLFWMWTRPYDRYLAGQYARAAVATAVFNNGASVTTIRDPSDHTVPVRLGDLYDAPFMMQTVVRLLRSWIACMIASLSTALAILALMFGAMWRFGRAQRREQLLRGSAIAEAEIVRAALRSAGMASDLTLAGVPLVKDSETQHILLTGSPRTGKTTTLYELLRKIRQRGDRVICYSPSGDFISAFYCQDKDLLLNPFDSRCPAWDPWLECPRDYHFDMLAGALIPTGKAADPMWEKAARVLVSSLLMRIGHYDQRSVGHFLHLLSEVELPVLAQFLQGTPAYALINPTAERTAQGIRITATAAAQALRHLPAKGKPFNLREWVLKDGNDQWVFLNVTAEQRDAARPILSTWLEVFTNSILSLPENQERRIWLIIDELPSLHRIPSLPAFLAKSRKFGGCGVIAFQMISQLIEIYDKQGADTLTGLCATWLCLRQNDPPTAEWTSKSFGQAEILEQAEGLSYGSHEMRDGVTLQQNRKMRDILLASEVRNLDDLEGYVRLRGKIRDTALPVAHFKMERPAVRSIAKPFIAARVEPRVPLAALILTHPSTAISNHEAQSADEAVASDPGEQGDKGEHRDDKVIDVVANPAAETVDSPPSSAPADRVGRIEIPALSRPRS